MIWHGNCRLGVVRNEVIAMKFAAIAIAAALLVPIAANATTLIDGSFEARGAATPVTQYCYDGFAIVNPACAAGPWSGGGVILSGNGAWGGSTAAGPGNYFAFVQGTQVLSQSFTATETGVGNLTWFDANRSNTGGQQSYTVSLFDGTSTTALGTYTSAIGGFVGRSTSPFALANGVTYTLSFTGLSIYTGTQDSDRTSFIDQVMLTSTAVPESSTWTMLVAGFAMVGAAMRRRKATVAA
jgi:hypothetical protein